MIVFDSFPLPSETFQLRYNGFGEVNGVYELHSIRDALKIYHLLQTLEYPAVYKPITLRGVTKCLTAEQTSRSEFISKNVSNVEDFYVIIQAILLQLRIDYIIHDYIWSIRFRLIRIDKSLKHIPVTLELATRVKTMQ